MKALLSFFLMAALWTGFVFTLGMIAGEVRSDRLRPPPIERVRVIDKTLRLKCPVIYDCDGQDRLNEEYVQGWDDGHRTCREDRERAR